MCRYCPLDAGNGLREGRPNRGVLWTKPQLRQAQKTAIRQQFGTDKLVCEVNKLTFIEGAPRARPSASCLQVGRSVSYKRGHTAAGQTASLECDLGGVDCPRDGFTQYWQRPRAQHDRLREQPS